MADFWRVMARLLLAGAPTADEQDVIPDNLWGAHQHGTGRHTLRQLLNDNAAEWMPDEVEEGTKAWNALHPNQAAHDINEAKNNALIQSQAEASSALDRKRHEARLRVKRNPRANPEEY